MEYVLTFNHFGQILILIMLVKMFFLISKKIITNFISRNIIMNMLFEKNDFFLIPTSQKYLTIFNNE
jgi:hypothetical protein